MDGARDKGLLLTGLADKSEERKSCALLNSLSEMVLECVNKIAISIKPPLYAHLVRTQTTHTDMHTHNIVYFNL